MQDRPTDRELLLGVRYFLEDHAIPELAGPAKFRARVAANAVRMLLRERETEEDGLTEECAGLGALLGREAAPPARMDRLRREVLEMNDELARRIREGEADSGAFRRRVLRHLRRTALHKLAVVNPAMAEAIRREWGAGS